MRILRNNRFSPWVLLALIAALWAIQGCVWSQKAEKNEAAAARSTQPPPDLLHNVVTLGRDDVFEVRVYQEPDMSGVYRVSDRGTINFPLIGEVMVEGRTPGEVEQEIRERLEKDYLKKAYVTVFVKEFNSQKIYLLGQVQKPGVYRYEANMTVVQAIALSGGFTPQAAKNDVIVTRLEKGVEKRIEVQVEPIWRGEKPNLLLLPGDIVFVPEALF